MSDNTSFLDDFGVDYDDIPDSFNLEGGSYENVVTTGARLLKVKHNTLGEVLKIVVTFKDVDPDSESIGKTYDWWIDTPYEKEKQVWYKRNLKTLGFTDDQIKSLGNFTKNPEQAAWFIGIEGSLILKTNNGHTNLKSFKLADEDGQAGVHNNGESRGTTEAPASVSATTTDDADWD